MARFSFDEQVVACFPDMIRRSVPGYGQVLAMLPVFAKRHLRFGSQVYDLGCSLGAASLALAGGLTPESFNLTAVDISPAMTQKAATIFQQSYPKHAMQVVTADIREFKLNPCGMVILNFTLQFLPVADRQAVLQRIYDALLPNGILVLSEKIQLENEQDNAWLVERYYDFKRANGYSELEISQKRDALENVLITDTISTHQHRLQTVGFTNSLPWFQYLNFTSLVAFKGES